MGLVSYEWKKLFSGRGKWMHVLIHVAPVLTLFMVAGLFEGETVLVLEGEVRARVFMQSANHMLSLVSVVYAVWLSSRLFMRQATDVIPLALHGRSRVAFVKWSLGGCLVLHHALISWLMVFLFFQLMPYHSQAFLALKIIPWFMVFSLHGFTFFALIMGFMHSPHSLTYVLGGFFLMDVLRSDVLRPEALNHIRYITLVILPSMLTCSDGTLVMMTSSWPVFLMHGLFLVLLTVHASIKRF